jgi:multidrug efflux pump subunit AcrB
MEAALRAVSDQTTTRSGAPLVQHVLGLSGGALDTSKKMGANIGSVQAVLLDADQRGVHSDQVLVDWEKAIGPIAGAESLSFANLERSPVARPIEVWLRGRDLDQLLAASRTFQQRLREFDGVSQVEQSYRVGKKEIRFALKPEARAMGLTVVDLAAQLQARFFGQEAIRIQRGREDVRVKVRYTAEERGRLSTLDAVRIRTPLGQEVPLFSVATATEMPGFSSILRIDGMRTEVVTASVDTKVSNTRQVLKELEQDCIPELTAAYPGIRVSMQGEDKAMQQSMDSLKAGFPLALIGIYVLIASVFRSYLQPVVIMATIPLGAFGALLSHQILGLDLTMLSLFGLVALAGVAVNDSIVMVEAVNEHLARGQRFEDAVREGPKRRFLAVMLTTITTVGGLAPLILETDFQARFLIPLAVSIAGGELFGTMLTVFVIPVALFILNDIRCAATRLRRGYWPTREQVEPARGRRAEAAAPAAAAVQGEPA